MATVLGLASRAAARKMGPTPEQAAVAVGRALRATSGPPPPAGRPAWAWPEEAAAGVEPATSVTAAALQALIRYLPVDLLATYVAVTATIGDDHHRAQFFAVVAFVVLTPAIVWLVYAGRRAPRRPLPAAPRTWPRWERWEMAAAATAFAPWAFAIHSSALDAVLPSTAAPYLGMGATIAAIATAYLLGLVEPLVIGE